MEFQKKKTEDRNRMIISLEYGLTGKPEKRCLLVAMVRESNRSQLIAPAITVHGRVPSEI